MFKSNTTNRLNTTLRATCLFVFDHLQDFKLFLRLKMVDNDRHVAGDVRLLFVFDGNMSTTTNVSSRAAHQDRISLPNTHCLSYLFPLDPSPMYSNSKPIPSHPVVSNCFVASLFIFFPFLYPYFAGWLTNTEPDGEVLAIPKGRLGN